MVEAAIYIHLQAFESAVSILDTTDLTVLITTIIIV